MPEFGPTPSSSESANRESDVLPATYAEQVQWQSFTDSRHTLERHRFQDTLSPRLPQQTKRYKALFTVKRIVDSPPSKPIQDLHLTSEELQAFMQPLLPSNDSMLQCTWLESQQSLELAPMRMIDSGREELSARRRQLWTALRHHQFQSGPIHIAMTFAQLREYDDLTTELLSELGRSLNTTFMGEVVSIIAISRSGLASFLNDWSETLEAEDLMDKVHAEIEGNSSHESNTDIHTRRLLLLVAGYEIQRHFQPGEEQTANGAYLPPCLSREGPYQYKHAAFWYAQIFGRQPALEVFAPSLSLKARATQGTERRWKTYWLQCFPSNWGFNQPPRCHGQLEDFTPTSIYSGEVLF